MLFIAASTVTTGRLSPSIMQGPDCRRQSSWQRVKGCDSYQWKGKAQLWKRNLKCAQGDAQTNECNYARWWWKRLGVPGKPIETGQKHHRLFNQIPLRKGKAFGHPNQYLSAAGAACQRAVRARWTKIPTSELWPASVGPLRAEQGEWHPCMLATGASASSSTWPRAMPGINTGWGMKALKVALSRRTCGF